MKARELKELGVDQLKEKLAQLNHWALTSSRKNWLS